MLPLTRILLLTALASAPFGLLYGQGSYEIQVYGSELVSPGATMFELHSNFTFEGSKTVVDGHIPPNTSYTRRSKSRTASAIGSNLVFTSSPARMRGSAGNGSAIISGRGSQCRNRGSGR
jgi:hypothetical protein